MTQTLMSFVSISLSLSLVTILLIELSYKNFKIYEINSIFKKFHVIYFLLNIFLDFLTNSIFCLV